MKTCFDVIVIGGGHAGIEAAWAAANLGADVAMVTLKRSTIGVMSCNPAIGGIAKGQMVREIDALGGLMGELADASGIMFKMLNTSKGPAVRSPRAQCDNHLYPRLARERIESRDRITIFEAPAEEFVIDRDGESARVRGVTLGGVHAGGTLRAEAVVLTTGTFMRGLMHRGEQKEAGGRAGEAPASTISDTLRALGFELGRLRTGTPPRLCRDSIDWDSLERQEGDDPPVPFSMVTPRDRDGLWTPPAEQAACAITRTSPEAHEHIRANLHRAPMYRGDLAQGPRYCPSIEDKVVRFADRDSHHVFLEPESHESDRVYANGIATSLPADIQAEVVRTMPGCANARVLQWGYAVEYDMVRPHQIHATCMTKSIDGLFLAGQINGTSGYEEAAGQGLIAGVNAARFACGEEAFTLGRDQAYIGVMMDDLVTKTPVEPYRMFTSRAEHRLVLRADNASDRLTALGVSLGVVDDRRAAIQSARSERIAGLQSLIDGAGLNGERLSKVIKRPLYTVADLRRDLGAIYSPDTSAAFDVGVLETVLAERQYAGYIDRQRAEIKRRAGLEHRRIPGWLLREPITGLRREAAQAIERFKPETLGQAGRLEGVNPADVTLLMVAMERR